MIKGVNAKEEKIIQDILKKYPYEFYYYGSRVKGDYTKASDLDILMKGGNSQAVEHINLEFNKSYIPYIVNISLYEAMDEHFYKLIEKDLVNIF